VYDPDFRRGAPGLNLLAHLIEWACEKGLREFEMGGGLEGYKRRWSDQQRYWQSAVIFHRGLRSRALSAAMTCAGLGRETLRRLRRRGKSAPDD
jgi:CelD/BcsL family acetyltransferase involved in cellulose biosynthesis